MELLEVDCGNRVERGLPPLNIPPPPNLRAKSGLSPTLSPLSPVDLRLGAAMRGDLWPIVIYVAVGSGARDVGRWRGEDGSEA